VSHSSKLIKPKKGGHGNLWSTVSGLEALITNWTCNWWLNWGESCRTEPLTCGIWCYLQAGSVRLNWILGHSAGVKGKLLGCVGKKSTHRNWCQNRTFKGEMPSSAKDAIMLAKMDPSSNIPWCFVCTFRVISSCYNSYVHILPLPLVCDPTEGGIRC